MEKFNPINSDRGSIAPACLLVLVLSLGLTAISLQMQRNYQRQVHNQVKQFRCLQNYHHRIADHIQRIELLNSVISSTKLIKVAAILYPPLRLLSAASTESIRNTCIGLQWGEVVSFQKKALQDLNKGCPLSPFGLISPYTSAGVSINRDSQHRAMVRKQQWQHIYRLALGRVIQVNYQKHHRTLKWQSKVIW